MNNDIFMYKLTTDNGGAPFVENELLSLCICKPNIRISAKVGDWIIGMGGKGVKDLKNRLIYLAKISEVLDDGRYYKIDKYKNRSDCIYQWKNQKYSWKKNSKYHSEDDLAHDLGKQPDYERDICLVSNEFVYFGQNKEPSIEEIQDIYDNLPRNYCINHDDDTRDRLLVFIKNIFEKYGHRKHGTPTHLDLTNKCNTSEDEVMQCIKECH